MTAAEKSTSTAAATGRKQRVYAVLNPVAGSYNRDDIRRKLGRYFPANGTTGESSCEIHETGPGDDLAKLVKNAVERGAELVVAAGGDGTVSAVAKGLVGTDTPLGIIPAGTANVLARELEIPLDLDGACQLLSGGHAVTAIDGMRANGRCYFTHVGVGIDAIMIRDTPREAKRRFGRLAYLCTAFTSLLGFQPQLIDLKTDAKEYHPRASQILVANVGVLGQPPFRWGPDIRPDDGRLDVCIVRARTLWDYLVVAWHVILGQHRRSPNVHYRTAERDVRIKTKRPLPVQADGEIIGETPVEIAVVRAAVKVVVPAGEPR